jgi:hypothetical protein
MGYINASGEFLIEPRFSGGFGFHEELASVVDAETGRMGVINFAGEYVIRPKFQKLFRFNGGYCKYAEGARLGFIDRAGVPALKPEFAKASDFSCGLVSVQFIGEYVVKIIDECGKVIREIDTYTLPVPSEGLVAVPLAGRKYGFIDLRGNVVIEGIYDFAKAFSGGLAPVTQDGRVFRYIRQDGSIAFPAQKFCDAFCFSEGLAAVCISRKNIMHFGYVNAEGAIQIECRFDLAGSFGKGLAPVQVENQWGFINAVGDLVIEPQYSSACSFTEELAEVWKAGRRHYVNTSGDVVWSDPP